jgi:cation diffusion facilitator family transporter
MRHCCEDKAAALRGLRERQARVLKLLLLVNSAMFVVEVVAGLLSRSTALLGDSLDMFGDAAAYAASLYVLDRGTVWRARASILKGTVMALFGVVVLVEAGPKAISQVVPHAETMGIVGALALAANVGCLVLLLRHRRDDINMKSAWTCSRNDIIANVALIGAAIAVGQSGSWWPDILVGAGIALLFLLTAVSVIREGIRSLRDHRGHLAYDRAS